MRPINSSYDRACAAAERSAADFLERYGRDGATVDYDDVGISDYDAAWDYIDRGLRDRGLEMHQSDCIAVRSIGG